MYLSENLQKKWEGVLDHPDLPAIKDPYRKAVTAVILENQAQEMQKSAGILHETAPTNSLGGTGYSGSSAAGGPVAGFDPILQAFDDITCGVTVPLFTFVKYRAFCRLCNFHHCIWQVISDRSSRQIHASNKPAIPFAFVVMLFTHPRN